MNKYNSIRLNGRSYSGEALLRLCIEKTANRNTPNWLFNIYNFILEWINDSDTIEAYTSGSTGKPKSIWLKKNHMVASAQKTIEFFNLKEYHSALLCLPAKYIAGKMMIVRAFVGGFNLLLQEPDGKPLRDFREQIDFAALIPLQISNSVNELISGNIVRNVIIGGGVISKELTNQIKDGKTACYETYGMTETVSHVAIRCLGDDLFTAMPNVSFDLDKRDCLIVNAEDVVDCLIVTNDIVELVSEKSFRWLGRYDNIINTGGVKVVPEEIEGKLSSILSQEFYISSVSNKKLGEEVVLVLKKPFNNKLSDVLSVFKVLNKYERPRKIYLVNDFPFSENNKIKRAQLQKNVSSAHIIYDADLA